MQQITTATFVKETPGAQLAEHHQAWAVIRVGNAWEGARLLVSTRVHPSHDSARAELAARLATLGFQLVTN